MRPGRLIRIRQLMRQRVPRNVRPNLISRVLPLLESLQGPAGCFPRVSTKDDLLLFGYPLD
jgi:hypothetical protein